jgi:hypothetical protein
LQLFGHAVVAPTGDSVQQPRLMSTGMAFYGKDPLFRDGSPEAFYDFVADGTGNSSIPTSLGRRHKGGCECRFPHGVSQGDHPIASQKGREAHENWDDDDNVPFCLSTFEGKHMPHQPEEPDAKSNKRNPQMLFANRHCMAPVDGQSGPIDREVKDLITECLTPNRNLTDHPVKTMFLLGDSHSAALLPALVLAVRGKYQVRHVYSDVVGLVPHRMHEGRDTNPGRFVDVYNHILTTLKSEFVEDDVVVLAMHAANFNHGVNPGDFPVTGRKGQGHVSDLNVSAVDLIQQDLLEGIVGPAHGKLFILGDWPYFPNLANPSSGLVDGKAEAKVDGQAKLQAQIEPLLGSQHPALRYKSLLPFFCSKGTVLQNSWTTAPEGACSSNIPGTNLQAFADDHHLTTVGSIYMWPHLCDLFEDATAEDAKTVPSTTF